MTRCLCHTPDAGTVEVIMPTIGTNEPSVCTATHLISTKIIFTEHRGDRPPMLLSRNTSNTRAWPSGSTPLSLGGSTAAATLRFATKHVLQCSACPKCFGRVYFQYGTSVTAPINITLPGIADTLETAIEQLEDLQDAKWTNLRVNVTVSDPLRRICSTIEATTTAIDIFSDYGNLPFLTLFDASYRIAGSVNAANLTLLTNAAADEVYECSNQGICDYSSGQCQCFQSVLKGDIKYRALSSDGKLM